MPTKVNLVEKPLDPDYHGTTLSTYYEIFKSGTLQVKGDHKKAVKAIYEVAVGEGLGVGKEREVQMVLGKDCAVRVGEIQAGLEHMMEVFGDVCNNVDIDEA